MENGPRNVPIIHIYFREILKFKFYFLYNGFFVTSYRRYMRKFAKMLRSPNQFLLGLLSESKHVSSPKFNTKYMKTQPSDKQTDIIKSI